MTDIASALTDLLRGDDDLETVVDRHFSPDYRQRTNGRVDDRAGFVEHIAHLRSIVKSVEIEVGCPGVFGHRKP